MSASHLVVIPSYNTGPRLRETVVSALAQWPNVWVVVDGSDDGSDLALEELSAKHPGFTLLRRPVNGGKGAAVFDVARQALETGFTAALVMDADGQHPASLIGPMMELSMRHPDCLVMGQPVFGPEVPRARLYGRRLTILCTELETLAAGLGDTLFGMRVYPLRDLCEIMGETRHARGYDFDPEVAVRLVWRGVRPVRIPVPVRYFTKEEGGVSHFNYLRDNLKLTGLQFRLLFHFIRSGALKAWQAKKSWNHPVH